MSDVADESGNLRSLRNTGRANLEKARFFAAHVEDIQQEDAPDLEQAEAYLDAAIVFGKATQDWLEVQYGLPWLKKSRLWKDPICEFFAKMRNVVIHEDGSVETIPRTHASVHISPAAILVSGNIVVMQSTRTNRPLLFRLWTKLRHRFEKVRARRLQRKLDRARHQRLAQLREEAKAQAESHIEAGQYTRFHFVHDDPLIAAPSALRVVNDYLDLLESVLMEAQSAHRKSLP